MVATMTHASYLRPGSMGKRTVLTSVHNEMICMHSGDIHCIHSCRYWDFLPQLDWLGWDMGPLILPVLLYVLIIPIADHVGAKPSWTMQNNSTTQNP
jgi:hypothetical protein